MDLRAFSRPLAALSILAAFAAASTPASVGAAPKGLNVRDAEQWAAAEKELKEKQKPFADVCGASVAPAFDDASYASLSYDDARATAACKLSYDALKEVCRSDQGKAAVKAKVQRFTCRYSTTGTHAALASGEMVVHLDPKKTSITGKQAGSYSWTSAFKEIL